MKNWYCYVLFLDEFRRVLPVSGDVELKEEDYNDIKSIEGKLRMAKFDDKTFYCAKIILVSDDKSECCKKKDEDEKQAKAEKSAAKQDSNVKKGRMKLNNIENFKEMVQSIESDDDLDYNADELEESDESSDYEPSPKKKKVERGGLKKSASETNVKKSFPKLKSKEAKAANERKKLETKNASGDVADMRSKKLMLKHTEKSSEKDIESSPKLKQKSGKSPGERSKLETKKAREDVSDMLSKELISESTEKSDNLDVLPMNVRLFLNKSLARKFVMTVTKQMNVKDIKAKLMKETGIAMSTQKLFTCSKSFHHEEKENVMNVWDGTAVVFMTFISKENKDTSCQLSFKESKSKEEMQPISPCLPNVSKSRKSISVDHPHHNQLPKPNLNPYSSHAMASSLPSPPASDLSCGASTHSVDLSGTLFTTPTSVHSRHINNGESPDAVLDEIAKINQKLDRLGNVVSNISDALESIVSCKTCMKGVLKTIKSANISSDISASKNLKKTAIVHVKTGNAAKQYEEPLGDTTGDEVSDSTATTSVTSKSAKTTAINAPEKDATCDEEEPSLVPLVEGKYDTLVQKDKLKSLKKSKNHKKFAIQLLEIVFTYEECKNGSTTGKSKKPNESFKKLDPIKLSRMEQYVSSKYPGENIEWGDMLTSIDTKCRGVRNGNYSAW